MPLERWRNKRAQIKRYKEIVNDIGALQRRTPEEQTARVFTLVRSRQELQPHEEEILEAHAEMLIEHEGSDPRKQSGDPYRVHPDQVAITVVHLLDLLGRPVTVPTFKAALHHDVWEDGKVKKERRLVKISEIPFLRHVEAVTRHYVKKENGKHEPIDHVQAAKKARKAHNAGVEDAIVLKTSDKLVNVRDQPAVHKPPLKERLVYSHTQEYKKSHYGKWKRLKRRTKGPFAHILLHDQPILEGVLFEGIKATQREINGRPKKSYKKQKGAIIKS